MRGNSNPPIEAVIGNRFQFALGTGYDGKNITRMAFSENITFIIITVIVAAAAGGDDERKKEKEKDFLSATAGIEQFIILLTPDVPALKCQQTDWVLSIVWNICPKQRSFLPFCKNLYVLLCQSNRFTNKEGAWLEKSCCGLVQNFN